MAKELRSFFSVKGVMSNRKEVPKRIRFEVLKRDKFTCQYCGRQAPDVILNVDHIKPISKGGTNEITNLITSCFDCNSGKSDIELSDDAAVKKQKAQLDMLQERREQLEMMREWQLELTDGILSEAQIVSDVVKKLTGCTLTPEGLGEADKLIRKFGLEMVCESTRIAFLRYKNRGLAWSKVGGICWCKTHTTCYNCKLFNGRDYKGRIDCPRGESEDIYSVKIASECEMFKEKE